MITQRDERVAGVVVDERGREHPPPLTPPGCRTTIRSRMLIALVRQTRQPTTPSTTSDDRRVGMRLVADPGDLAAAQTRQRRRRRTAARPLGDPAVAIDLRRALAQPRAAIRALGDVRADLRSAVLADDEQIRATGTHALKCKSRLQAAPTVYTGRPRRARRHRRARLDSWRNVSQIPAKVDLHASWLRRQAVHPRVRSSRVVPEEDVRDSAATRRPRRPRRSPTPSD